MSGNERTSGAGPGAAGLTPEPEAVPGPLPGRRWLPSAIAVEIGPGRVARVGRTGRPRRTVRDWVVDFAAFLLAVVVGLLGADSLPKHPDLPYALEVADQWVGAFACAAVGRSASPWP